MADERVLVVDDDAQLRKMIVVELRKARYEALAAASLAEAEMALSAGPVDLVLLDLLLDERNGWENIARLGSLSKAPILIMTGASVDDDSMADARLLGARGMLGKPFGAGDLLAAIRGVLDEPEAV